MEKVLSISVAAYNVEKFIDQTLSSLIDETIIDKLEIFVIDDGGTDNTLDIVKKYSDKYPDSIYPVHKENGGYGSVINTSTQLASGKYFKQLDGDDWFDKNNLGEFVRLLETINTDYVFTPVIVNYESGDKEKLQDFVDYFDEGSYLFKDVAFSKFVTMHSTTVRTQLLKDMNLKITENSFYTDLELVYKPLCMANSFYVWHHSIYHYRVGLEGQSGSVSGIKKHAAEHLARVQDLIKLYKGMPNDPRKDLLGLRVIKQVQNQCRVFAVLGMKEWNNVKAFLNSFKETCPGLVPQSMSFSRRLNLLYKTKYLIFPVLVAVERINRDNKPV